MVDSIPEKLDELELDESLGRGVTCTVRLAVARCNSKQRFAAKIVEKASIVGQAQLTRLFREKELLGTLSHPSIVTFYATFQDETHLYFLLELLRGGELLWHMRRAPHQRVAEESTRSCIAALLLPLQYMHEQGVLYRDLKPTNIMFTETGRLKLVDFGHAKRVEAGERSISVCGTPHYHAPETVCGDGHGFPAQLWALGVLLAELTLGEAPFWERPGRPPLKVQILEHKPQLEAMPVEMRALAGALLEPSAEARERLFPAGYADVMVHQWLALLDWDAIKDGRCVPAFDFAAHAAHCVPEDHGNVPADLFADF